MKTFSSLSRGLSIFKSHYLELIAYAYLLDLMGSVPTLISKLKDQQLLAAPPTAFGFLMILSFWSAETFILVGVSQITWRALRGQSFTFRNFLPDVESMSPVVLWAVLISLLLFGATIAQSSGVTCVRSKCMAFPILPFFFYVLAVVPLLIVDRRLCVWTALKYMASAARRYWLEFLKLSLIAEVIWLVIPGGFVFLQGDLIQNILVVHFGAELFAAIASVISASMMASAYAEMYKLIDKT